MSDLVTDSMREFMAQQAEDSGLRGRLEKLAEDQKDSLFATSLKLFGGALVPIDQVEGFRDIDLPRRSLFILGGLFGDYLYNASGQHMTSERLHYYGFMSVHSDGALGGVVKLEVDKAELVENAGIMREAGNLIKESSLGALCLHGVEDVAESLDANVNTSPESSGCFKIGFGWVLRLASFSLGVDWDGELKSLTPDIE